MTLIDAPNSHGKTSITEALEFLVYGYTSKVRNATGSKDEYSDSYRNVHFSISRPAVIEAAFECSDGTDTLYRVELTNDGRTSRFVDGSAVLEWPVADTINDASRPFVVQHALKNLLMAPPTDRFQGFAGLLGLNDIEEMQRLLVNLCTKPEVHAGHAVKQALSDFKVLRTRMDPIPSLAKAAKELDKMAGSSRAFQELMTRATALVGPTRSDDEMLALLIRARDEANAKVYARSANVRDLSTTDLRQVEATTPSITILVAPATVDGYSRLAAGDAQERLQNEYQMLKLSAEFIELAPTKCPVCGQALDEVHRDHIAKRRNDLQEGQPTDPIHMLRTRIGDTLRAVEPAAKLLADLTLKRLADLGVLGQEADKAKLQSLLGDRFDDQWAILHPASQTTVGIAKAVRAAQVALTDAASHCLAAVASKKEAIADIETLAKTAAEFLTALSQVHEEAKRLKPVVRLPAEMVRAAIEGQSGSAELSVLTDLWSQRAQVTRTLDVRDTLEGMKTLKKHVEQSVAEVMETAFTEDLTASVMRWYGMIKTAGDPDVHFSGFSMGRVKSGAFKSRRVEVNATSYGERLSSAVSSLSESKLNALGLCVSIATATRAPKPWGFLVIDDPIQSWDEEHEQQFNEIVRTLIADGKQVVLLSHRKTWINGVADGTRTANGTRYEITGYTKLGPQLKQVEWATVDQRLKEALAIAKDQTASSVRLQQAEEEIRLAASMLVAQAAKTRLKRDRSANSINQTDCRSILTEAGCDQAMVDRVASTFNTTDDSHHAPDDYQVSRQRVIQYHSYLADLRHWLK